MSESRFELGGYIAEVLQAKGGGDSWYYAIQTQTGEIVSIERFDVYEEARDEALKALNRLNRAAAAGE